MRIVELIAREDAVKGGLLRRVVEVAEQVHRAEVIGIDVNATHPRMQRTMVELGFMPVAYVPGMVFHNNHRWDVVRMMKINVPWELGKLALVPAAQAVFDIVTLPFIRRDAQRRMREAVASMPVLHGLTSLEIDFLVRIAEEIKLGAGESMAVNGLCIILEGGVQVGERNLGRGECFGERLLLAGQGELTTTATSPSSLLGISQQPFNELIERYPHLGVKLFRNFYQLAGSAN